MLSSFLAASQEQKKDKPSNEIYCMVLAYSKLLSTKISIAVDYGQEQNFWKGGWRGERIRTEEGKIKNFNSVVDALNYMSDEGWTFVNAYAITQGGQNVYHYVMKKEIDKDKIEEQQADEPTL
jgi:hypothetical protein